MCVRHGDSPDDRCLRCREDIYDQHEQADQCEDWQPWRWRQFALVDSIAWLIVAAATAAALCVLWDDPRPAPAPDHLGGRP